MMSKVEQFNKWACTTLAHLGLPDASDIIRYLQPLEDPAEVREYLNSMLDMKKPKHIQFVENFIEKQAESKVDNRFYRKGESNNVGNGGAKKKNKNIANQSNKNGKSVFSLDLDSKGKQSTPEYIGKNGNNGKENKDCSLGNSTPESAQTTGKLSTTKKKAKQANCLADIVNDVVLRKGRHPCECLASKHALVNNCLACGRIVCGQEGAGACMTCGEMVRGRDAKCAPPGRGGGAEAAPSLKDLTISGDVAKAIQHKNRLLEFDQTSEKRTKVFDDENDYFDSNSRWISKEQREKLQAREQELKDEKYDRSRSRKVTLDLLGRKVVSEKDEHQSVFNPDDPVLQAIIAESTTEDIFSSCKRNNDEPPKQVQRPIYVDSNEDNSKKLTSKPNSGKKVTTGAAVDRLQDASLQEMTDRGRCLSMHQPYASLLIRGLKTDEGRTWYSSHRGRLWIAAAAHVPSEEKVAAVEAGVRARLGDVSMPQHYPTGVLLGHCDVEDVLCQEEYRLRWPDGDSLSPFVFLCRNPTEMQFKFPLKGDHKIFSLDPATHKMAKKTAML